MELICPPFLKEKLEKGDTKNMVKDCGEERNNELVILRSKVQAVDKMEMVCGGLMYNKTSGK